MINPRFVDEIQSDLRLKAYEMIKELGIDNLCKQLESYPEKIRLQQNLLITAQQQVEEAKQQMETAKAVVTAEVNAEVGENGKPKYSNEKARESEIVKRLQNDEFYVSSRKNMMKAEETLSQIRFEIEKLQSEQANLRTIIKARTAQLSAIFSS